MTSACGVVTDIYTEENGFNEGKVNKQVRSALKGQTPVTVEFPVGTDGITIELIEQVEKALSVAGKHTYLYAPENGEPIADVVRHLNEAGIIVLLALDGIQTHKHVKEESRSYYTYEDWKEETDGSVEGITAFMKKISAFSTDISRDRDYI